MKLHNHLLNSIDVTRLETRIDDQRTKYQMTDAGSLQLSKYSGDYRVLSIPEKHGNISITSISSKAFDQNRVVKTIILTKNITKIDEDAFIGTDHVMIYTPFMQDEVDFNSVQNVIFRYGLDRIVTNEDVNYALFQDLNAVVFDHDLLKRQFDKFGRFGEHIQLKSIIDGKYTVNTIESFAFMNTINLKNVDLPKQLKVIGFRAFYNCEKIKSVIFPDLLMKIDDCSFERCLALNKIIIPESVEYIGKNCFKDTYRAMVFMEGENQDLLWNDEWNPEKLPVLKRFGLFVKKDKIEYALTNYKTAVVVNNYFDDLTNAVIPAQIILNDIKYRVTEIFPFAFEGQKLLTGVRLPNTIHSIHSMAFAGSNLIELKIPDSVEMISRGICADAIFLKKVVLGKGILSISDSAFANDISLVEVDIPQTIVEIKMGSFFNCRRLSRIELPFFLKKIGDSAFNGTNLTYAEIGEMMAEVGDSCYESIESLRTMTVLNEEVKLGENLVSEHLKVDFFIVGKEDSILHNTLQKLAPQKSRIFCETYKIQEVDGIRYCLNMNNTARVIGYNFKNIEIDVIIRKETAGCRVTHIEAGSLRNASMIRSLEVSDSVIYIGENFIEGCSRLKKLTIPSHLNPLMTSCIIGTKNLKIILKDNSV